MVNKYFFSGDNYHNLYIAMLSKIMNQWEYKGEARGTYFYEITNMTMELTNPYNRLVWSPDRRANYEFAMKMFLWMLNGDDDAEFLTTINPNAKNYLENTDNEKPEKPRFATAYGPRIVKGLPEVLAELCRDKNSRRGTIPILTIDDQQYLNQNVIEFPCIESISFYIRDDQLNCHVSMRSNNMATTVVYDVFCFTMFQEYVLNMLNISDAYNGQLKMGKYQHHILSAHYFLEQHQLVSNIVKNSDKGVYLFRSDKR